MGIRKVGLFGLAALGALGAGQGTATAAPSCTYSSATHTVTSSSETNVIFKVLSGGAIGFNGSQCGTATVTNTDTIGFTNTSPSASIEIDIDLGGGQFAPGFTAEPDNVLFNPDEIEFEVNGAGKVNFFDIDPGSGNNGISFGTSGIDLNTLSEGPFSIKDVEVSNGSGAFPNLGASALVRMFMAGGNDVLKGDGSDNTGGPSPARKVLSGGAGNDIISGGDGSFDNLLPGIGDDTVDGKGGTGNHLTMGQSNPGVTVDLRISGPQDTVGSGTDSYANIDTVQGTDQPDVLTGTSGPNEITGLGGADVIRGAGGADELFGVANGSPELHQGDTVAYDDVLVLGGQTVDLGAGTASGAQGADQLDNFDNVIGTPLADTLTGSDQANRITGGGDDDDIFGLAGADTLLAADGVHDDVDCGADSDLDTVDQDIGVDVLSNCGTDDFNRPPAPPTQPPAASAPGPTCKNVKRKKRKRAAAAKKKKKKAKCKKKKRKKGNKQSL